MRNSLGRSDDVTVSHTSSSPHRMCQTWLLPAGPGRAEAAQAILSALVPVWGLPAFRSRRWLTGAADVLAGPGQLEMCLQLDRLSDLVTLELWSDARVVFGIDDWIGL